MTQLNIFQRIILVMKDVKCIKEEDKKVNGQNPNVSHGEVTKALRDPMIKHGIVYS